ncbi:MAG: thiol:disulfide interchange protein DsbA/DsbL [Kangiellaceae bacterium]|nr:thiol:disulfide interchange protein DsbA/DsbL [Kangiellaceae bacterium]MCW8999060.1 thiol:disulfide interchange protein DsbA/DsbL [Kangiellaceae bacterium]
MKKIITSLFALFLLVGCQGEEATSNSENKEVEVKSDAPPAPKKDELVKAEKKEASHNGHAAHDEHSGHDHATPIPPGEKYQVVDQNFECEGPVVIEFFAYQCPHCYNLEPAAKKWRAKNADNGGKVKFISVPTTLGHQQYGSVLLVHHAAKLLGVLEKTQHALFKRLHEDRRLFASPEEAAEFLIAQGADKNKALEILNDEKLMSDSIEQDFEYLRKYKISSVPQVLVNHKYMTNITAAGGHDEVFKLVDNLLELEHNCVK